MKKIGVLGLVFMIGMGGTCGRSLHINTITPEAQCSQEGMAYVPAGWFLMGEDDGRNSNQPQHKVFLEAYCIMRNEVTREMFSVFINVSRYAVMGWEGDKPDEDGKAPVTGVLWKDAAAYCEWAGLRLPSEAEWEKAARGEDGRKYPWGNEWDATKANISPSGIGKLMPVGNFPAGSSPYSLVDMCGNAAEWVNDYFDFNYYAISPAYNPPGPETILDHGLRGGSYASLVNEATTYFRDSSHSVLPNPRAGFRCAQTP